MLFERFYVRDGRQSLPSATPLVQTPSGVIAILVAFLSSLVPARPQAASSSYTAEFYVAGCKDFLAEVQFLSWAMCGSHRGPQRVE